MSAISTSKSGKGEKPTLAGMLSRVSELETQLGIPHADKPLVGPVRLYQRIADLEDQLAARGISPVATATAPAPVTTTLPTPAAKVETVAEVVTAQSYLTKSDADRAAYCRAGGALDKAEFAKMKPAECMQFCKAGGKVVDGPVTARPVASTGTVITREHFDRMTPTIKMAYILNGGKLSE